MKTIIIQTFDHDGFVFQYTWEAVFSISPVIGYYFDRKGMPVPIQRGTVYADVVIGIAKEQVKKTEFMHPCNKKKKRNKPF